MTYLKAAMLDPSRQPDLTGGFVSELDINVPMIDPAKYIIRVANNLNFDEKAKRKHDRFYTLPCKPF